MKKITEFLSSQRADRMARAAVHLAVFCAALCLAALTVAVVVKTARIVADTEARCDARERVCAGPAW